MNIQQFRAKYPQYNALSDTDLANKLYAKYYSRIPKDEFDTKFLGAPKTSIMDKVSHLIGSDGSLGGQISDFLGGIENPIINAVNLAPEAERSIVNAVGLPKLAIPNIPNIPTENNTASLAGNVVGSLLPFGAAAKTVEAARGLPALLSGTERLAAQPTKLSNIVEGATSGALGGAASNQTGSRTEGALGGAVGGSIGGAFSPVAKSIETPSLNDIHELIANKHIDLHNQANQIYKQTAKAAKTFDEKNPNAITTPAYTQKAQDILDQIQGEKGAPSILDTDIKNVVSSIAKKPQDTVSGLLTERQKLNNVLSKPGLDNASKSMINDLKGAAQDDLANLPDNLKDPSLASAKNGLSELQAPYEKANALWAKMKGLAGKNPTKRQQDLMHNLVGANDYDDAGNIIGNSLDRAAFDKLYLSKPSNGSASRNYENLTNASDINKNIVAHAIKNEPFKNETDEKAFHKFYRSVSKDQNAKNWLFSPNEQNILNKAVNKKPSKFSWPIFLGLEALSHHSGIHPLGATFPAYLAAKAGSKGLNQLLSRGVQPNMLENVSNNINYSRSGNSGLGALQERGLTALLAGLGSSIGGHPNGN